MGIFIDKWLMLFLFSLPFGFPAQKNDLTATTGFHPFYISVFDINHNSNEKSIEVTVKIFSDDLENVLRKKYRVDVDVSSEKHQEKNEEMINGYLQEHFSLEADGKKLNWKMLGFEKDKESIYTYLEIKNVTSLNKVRITNTVLYDLTSDQVNIIHFVTGGKRESRKLNHPDKTVEIIF